MRILVHALRIFCRILSGGRYSIFPTGELHIRGASLEDGFKSYRCVTRNRLTGEVAPSAAAGKLFVTGKYKYCAVVLCRVLLRVFFRILHLCLKELKYLNFHKKH